MAGQKLNETNTGAVKKCLDSTRVDCVTVVKMNLI
jgi:hypothetical protein